MNRFVALLVVGVAVLSLPVCVHADAYTITKFDGEEVGAPDDFIDADFNGELKKANPNALQDGRFYVRQKFEDPFDEEATTYGLYQGKLTAAGKARLGKFSMDKPYSEVLKTKFYLSAKAKSDMDVDRVYFDGKFVYVEGESPIYINVDGQMTALKPSIEKVSYFNITTRPSGVSISINGESKGTTPSKVSLLGTRSAVLTLSKEGYYTKCRILKPKPGNTLDVGELLTEKKDIETPSTKFKLKCLEVSRKKDPAAVKDLRSALQDQIDRWPKESKALIEKQMALYPPNPSQGSDEGVEDYQTRTDAWEKDRDAEEERQQGVADQCAHDLDSLVELLDQDQDATAASPMLYSFSESSSSMSSSSEYEEDRSSESEVGSDEYDSSEDTAESNYVERDTDDSYAEDSDARDEAVDDAVNDMDARFGRGDEYRKWGAWALVATAVGSGVVAVLQHMKYSDAKTDYDDAKENLDDLHDNIDSACSQNFPSNYDYCVEALTASETVQQYQEVVDHNKSVMNSYASGRNVFLVFTAASVAGSVILFTW